MTQPTVRLVDPTGAHPGDRRFPLAPRPRDLRGKRVVLLDNSKANSEPILRAIAKILDDEFRLGDVVHLTKHSASLPPRPELAAEVRRHADVVITGVGD
jgi:hypothetical protein